MGRKPSQYVPMAYDYRRVIFLVQVLAHYDESQIYRLCEDWGIDVVGNDLMATLRRLAQHTLEYSKETMGKPLPSLEDTIG